MLRNHSKSSCGEAGDSIAPDENNTQERILMPMLDSKEIQKMGIRDLDHLYKQFPFLSSTVFRSLSTKFSGLDQRGSGLPIILFRECVLIDKEYSYFARLTLHGVFLLYGHSRPRPQFSLILFEEGKALPFDLKCLRKRNFMDGTWSSEEIRIKTFMWYKPLFT